MFLQPVQLASPPALIAESRDAQAQIEAARQRAFRAATELGCTAETFVPFDHKGKNDLLFTCSRSGEKIILKAHLGDSASLVGWREPLYASLASQYKLGAPTYTVLSVPGVITSKFLQGRPLQAMELRKVDYDVVTLLHDLHESIGIADARVTPKTDRSELFVAAFDQLKRGEIQNLLGAAATTSFRARLSWLQDRLRPIPYQQKFINGDIHPGNLIREDGSLRIIDWGTARSDDPLFDLVRMSFTLRTPNSRLLQYLSHYAARSGREVTAQEELSVLLQQAVNNVRWYLVWLEDVGPDGYKTQGMVTRLLDDSNSLIDMPKLVLPTSTLNEAHKISAPKSLEEARSLTNLFVAAMLPQGASVTEPLANPGGRFAYFRVSAEDQDWFIKVFLGAQASSTWTEPAWMFWAADGGFGPQVQPSSGTGPFANVLASDWISGDHLNRTTANEPRARKAILEKMRQLHQTAAPSHLVSAAPEESPQYAGAAWAGLDALETEGIQNPLSTHCLRQMLSRVLHELDGEPVRQVICHRDTHPRNMFYNDGKAFFIDWDWAGWDDPMRDPARFFVLGYTPLAELRDSLAIYLGHVASPAELRHLQLLMLATEIDFYCANQADASPSHRSVTERAERIEQLAALLGLQ